MQSMTGFGLGEAELAGVTITCELRAVNHRFLDIALKLPAALSFLEGDVRAFLRERVARGRVAASLQIAQRADTPTAMLEPTRLDQVLDQLRQISSRLAETTAEPQPIRLEHILAVPDLFGEEDLVVEQEELRRAAMQAVTTATDALRATKEEEGRKLGAEIRTRLDRVRTHLDEVEQLAPRAATEAHDRLKARVAQLLDDEIDPQRLAQEVAFLADRANINEECERLAVHITSFREVIASQGQTAKRLNFLLQEMHREVNTMGSKTNLMEITQLVIAMKEEIESIREQMQNLE
jgi:uncharacterized protein (TIGR00255 family)